MQQRTMLETVQGYFVHLRRISQLQLFGDHPTREILLPCGDVLPRALRLAARSNTTWAASSELCIGCDFSTVLIEPWCFKRSTKTSRSICNCSTICCKTSTERGGEGTSASCALSRRSASSALANLSASASLRDSALRRTP